jgi:hypothetical protein
MAATNPNDPCAKGPVTYCLDELSTRDDAHARLDALRAAIIRLKEKQYRGLEKVFATHLFKDFYNKEQVKKITNYLKSCWFDEKSGWWPSFQPIAPIYAEGLLTALNASLQSTRVLPFDSYWIIGHGQVEILSLISKRQVTLLIATPPPIELAPKGIWSEFSQAWVTARRAGKSAHEVNPTDLDKKIQGSTDLRVRTFKIETRKPKG